MDNSIIPLVPVILSGGVGSRLWPVSRKQHPKPFIKLPDGDTLMAKTLNRSLSVTQSNELMVVTNRDLYFHTKDEIINLQAQGVLRNDLIQELCTGAIWTKYSPCRNFCRLSII